MRRVLDAILLTAVTLGCAAGTFPQQSKPAPESEPEAKPYVPPSAAKSAEIGNFYLKKKQYKGALSRFQEAVLTDPHYAPGYLGLGKVYEKIGLNQKALVAYQHYLDALPSEKEADDAKQVHSAMARLERELASSGEPPANSKH